MDRDLIYLQGGSEYHRLRSDTQSYGRAVADR